MGLRRDIDWRAREDAAVRSLTCPLRGNMPARSVESVLGDVERLLAALSIAPPYVLVGHTGPQERNAVARGMPA